MATKHNTDRSHLEQAKAIARAIAPNAVAMHLETSDQNYYGFVLQTIELNDGTHLEPEDDHKENIEAHLADLDWDSEVGENKQGYARVAL